MPERDDNQLIQDYLKGDEGALAILFNRYLKIFYAFIYHYVDNAAEAEDLTQETFLKAWKNLKKFEPEKSFKSWGLTIARNTAIDHLRKNKSWPLASLTEEVEAEIMETLTDPAPLPSEIFQRQDLQEKLLAAIKTLPTKDQEVLLARHYDDLSFQEIADLLGEPLNTIKSRQLRALDKLRALLAD